MLAPHHGKPTRSEPKRGRSSLGHLDDVAGAEKMSTITMIWAVIMLILLGVIQPGLTGVL